MSTGLNAHIVVAKTAIRMAHELYEVWARQNHIYKQLKEATERGFKVKDPRRLFVKRVAPTLLQDARRAMAQTIAHPDTTEYMREQLAEALIKDAMLQANRFVEKERADVPSIVH